MNHSTATSSPPTPDTALAEEALPRLTSWTRTLNEDDALSLLDSATPGMTVSEWESLAHQGLPQASRDRRRELVRIVRDELLDHDGGTILNSPYLRLLQQGSPWRRLCLLYGRRLRRFPLAERTLQALILPALERLEEPLAPHEAGLLTQEDWDAFLHRTLHLTTGPEAFHKTRTTLQRHFARIGVLEISGTIHRLTRVQHAEPDPLAFCWLLGHELLRSGRLEAPQSWACHQSFAARVFGVRPSYAQVCLERGIDAELLRRGYLAGVERIHPVQETQPQECSP